MGNTEREVRINHRNRDRKGGHMFRTYYAHLASNLNGHKDCKRQVRRAIRHDSFSLVRDDLIAYHEDKHLNYLEQRQNQMDDENFYAHMEDEYQINWDDIYADEPDDKYEPNDFDDYQGCYHEYDSYDYRHDSNEMNRDYPNFFNPAPLMHNSNDSIRDIIKGKLNV